MHTLGGLVWLVVIVVLVKESKERLKTTFYVLATMALTLGLGFGSTWVFPTISTNAIGLGTRYAVLLVGVLTALVCYRRSRG